MRRHFRYDTQAESKQQLTSGKPTGMLSCSGRSKMRAPLGQPSLAPASYRDLPLPKVKKHEKSSKS